MKKLKIVLSTALLCLTVCVFFSCLEENFIPDPNEPRLPKYTESGNQVGGALINDVAWKTNFSTGIDMWPNYAFTFTNYASRDSVTLRIDGLFTEGAHQDALISFIIVLRNVSFEKLADIKSLDGYTFALDGIVNSVTLDDRFETIGGGVRYYHGGTGTIVFKNIKTNKSITYSDQNDQEYHPLIVAGTFDFTFQEISTVVSLGRFDFQINNNYLEQR